VHSHRGAQRRWIRLANLPPDYSPLIMLERATVPVGRLHRHLYLFIRAKYPAGGRFWRAQLRRHRPFRDLTAAVFDDDHRAVIEVANPLMRLFPLDQATRSSSPQRTGLTALASSLMLSTGRLDVATRLV